MRVALVCVCVVFAALSGLATPGAAAQPSSVCSPACPPAPAVVYFDVEPKADLRFDGADAINASGTVTYAVNVTAHGWYFDPSDEPKITFFVADGPWWVSATVEPPEIIVPFHDPQYVDSDGWYRYTVPIEAQFRLEGTPTYEDLADARTGTPESHYRVLLAAQSDSTMTAEGDIVTIGTMKGYGVADFRFLPETGWDTHDPSEPQPVRLAGHATPGLGTWTLALVLAGVAATINTKAKKPLYPIEPF